MSCHTHTNRHMQRTAIHNFKFPVYFLAFLLREAIQMSKLIFPGFGFWLKRGIQAGAELCQAGASYIEVIEVIFYLSKYCGRLPVSKQIGVVFH